MVKFKVIREHGGYRIGEIREAEEHDVSHLIGKCLVKIQSEPETKLAPPLKNKAAKPSRNKAAK